MDHELVTWVKEISSNSAFTALLGALVGGWFTRNATLKAHALNKRAASVDSFEGTKATLTLIGVELKAVWGVYNKEYRPRLFALPDGHANIWSWAIGENNFVIYDSMPQCLSEIDPAVAESVVHLYLRLKGMVAMIEENNRYSEIAAQAGLQQLDAMLAIEMKSGEEMSAERAGQHQEFLLAWTEFHAVKIGMGALADVMKAFTLELDEYIEHVIAGLESEVNSISRKVQELSVKKPS